MEDLNRYSHKSVFLITRLIGSFRFKREDCVLSPKSRGRDHSETTRRYILPSSCILVNPHDIILAFPLFSDQVARSAKPCLHFSLRREAWPWEGRRAISKSRFQFRFLLHGEKKSRVRLSSRGAGEGDGHLGLRESRRRGWKHVRKSEILTSLPFASIVLLFLS